LQRSELRQLIDQGHRGTVADCRITEALAPRAQVNEPKKHWMAVEVPAKLLELADMA
jgi:hypothetical protein